MRYGIYRYTMLPGLAELAAKDWLTKKGYKVTLFPQVDRFDLAVELDTHTVFLDMKDFKHRERLAWMVHRLREVCITFESTTAQPYPLKMTGTLKKYLQFKEYEFSEAEAEFLEL